MQSPDVVSPHGLCIDSSFNSLHQRRSWSGTRAHHNVQASHNGVAAGLHGVEHSHWTDQRPCREGQRRVAGRGLPSRRQDASAAYEQVGHMLSVSQF